MLLISFFRSARPAVFGGKYVYFSCCRFVNSLLTERWISEYCNIFHRPYHIIWSSNWGVFVIIFRVNTFLWALRHQKANRFFKQCRHAYFIQNLFKWMLLKKSRKGKKHRKWRQHSILACLVLYLYFEFFCWFYFTCCEEIDYA